MKNQDSVAITARITTFLAEIGIEAEARDLDDETFLPGIRVENGILYYDPARLRYPGDLLHEAGHLAVLTPAERGSARDDFAGDGGAEMGAIAWSYAACLHIGLPPDVLFHEEGYKGDARWLADNFSRGTYIGLPILQWKGMAVAEGGSAYPQMLYWLCPGEADATHG